MRLLVWGRKGLLSVLFLALLVSLVVTAMPADRADVDQDGHGHGGVPETQGWSDIVGQMLPFDFIADPSQTEQPQQQTGKRNAGNNPSTQKRKKTKTEAHPADPLTPYWNDKHEEVQLQLIQLELNRLQSTEGLTFAAFVHAVCGPLHKMKDEPFDYNDPKTPLLFEYRSLLENAFTNHLSTFGMLDEPTLDHSAGTSGSHLLPTISSHIARIRKYFDEVDLVMLCHRCFSILPISTS
ncbi:hypothetical protein CXG81DRAFT_17607 [Caulochytrium protostelioides]|uniref:Uncharacterized protein n=1 Tax=Caulochytrium protostelioides TaxID=1555241 RepID=A0A4P9XC38_9FUNG|nr:hypothetical protein CXG81DRAFT_17607 [Caulochytrium protostelioides]|eukprot:RKP02720.1 hypothetical protein CXG81DRAFT_17607 [Caulochytrium protostelioides]